MALGKLKFSFRIRRRKPRVIEVKEPDFGERPSYLEKHIREFVEKYKEEPMIVDRPTGDMKTWKKYNVIYPVGGGVFIHATNVARSETGYPRYLVIEPPRPPMRLFKLIEEALALKIKPEHLAESAEERKKILLILLDEILKPVDKPVNYDEIRPRNSTIPVYQEDIDYIKYHLIRDKIGVGVLEPFLRDPYLEDISCRGLGNIYIVHKIFGSMESNVGFKSEEELDDFIIKLGEKIGKPISRARPVVDATLPDGSRINIVYGSDVSLFGSNFTIRKVAKIPLSVIQLIKWKTFNEYAAAYMWIMLSEGMSAFICGETASGKTTTLNAIAVFIRPDAKIVTIEDTAEVVLPHPNWVRELTRDTGRPESSVTMFDLLKAALRQRPNYIIVGEIRGAEGNIAFQAMQSVSWDTPILIRNTKTDEIELIPIGEFVDQFYGEGEEGRPKTIDEYEVLSMDKLGRVKWSKIKYVLRHKASEVYVITYEGKGVIKATGSHSVFILDLDTLEVKPKLVSELKKGDLLISLNSKSFKKYYDNSVRVLGKHKIRSWSERIPLKPIIRILERNGLNTKLPLGLTYIVRRYRLSKQKYVLRNTAKKIVEFIEKYNDILDEHSKELLERLKIIIESDLAFLEVLDVKKEKYNGYVYDVSVPETELFIGGNIPIALHNTGHPVMATFHAANLERLLQRLTNYPIQVPKTNLDNLNIAWFQSSVYSKTGLLVRRMISVYEIIGYDPTSDSIAAVPVFTWDPTTDTHRFAGRGASYLLEEKIAVMRGISRKNIKLIYEELDLRAKFLRALADKNIVNYYDVYKAIVKTYELGLEEAYKRLLRGDLLT